MRCAFPLDLASACLGFPTDDGCRGVLRPLRASLRNLKPEDVEEWRELNTRRSARLRHFSAPTENRRTARCGSSATRRVLRIRLSSSSMLRYRLLPYVYSIAGSITTHGTMMVPPAMDFRNDAKAREISDEYMFGPALLVSPVTTYKARDRSVYLPSGAAWYDFWPGTFHAGGRDHRCARTV